MVSIAELRTTSLLFTVVLVVVVLVGVRVAAIASGVVRCGNVFVEEGGQIHVGVFARGMWQLATGFVIVVIMFMVVVMSVLEIV